MKTNITRSILSLAVIGAIYGISSASAAPLLGSAQSFAVLGASTVTNAHVANNTATHVYGNLGGPSVTGFAPDGIVSGGTNHINDGVALLALAHATSAYNNLAGRTFDYTNSALGSGSTLTPGVYRFTSSAQLTGALTLDFGNTPNAEFIFQIASTLTTASGSSINVINGSSLNSVYWQVGSSATLGSDTVFAGNILALASITLNPRAKILCGRAFALTAAVTLIDNLVSNDCTAENFTTTHVDFGSSGFSGAESIPEPAPLVLMTIGLAELMRRRRSLSN